MENAIPELKERIEGFLTWDDFNIEDRLKRYDKFYLDIVTEYHMELQDYRVKEDAVEDWVQEEVEKKIISGEAVSGRSAEEQLKKTKPYKDLHRELQVHEGYVNYMNEAVKSIRNFSFTLQKYLDRKKMIEGF